MRRSASPESPNPWYPSRRHAVSPKGSQWLNIPCPDSPKQNWMPVSLPKIPVGPKSWVPQSPKRSEFESASEWTEKSQDGNFSKHQDLPRNWPSPPLKGPISPNSTIGNTKHLESPKTWQSGSEIPNNGHEWETNALSDKQSWSVSIEERQRQEVEPPKEWGVTGSSIKAHDPPSPPKHPWLRSPEPSSTEVTNVLRTPQWPQ